MAADAAELLTVELERTVSRVRLVAGRMAQREGQQAADVLNDIRQVVQGLADLGARVEGRPVREVPLEGPNYLADQLAVVTNDVLRYGAPADLAEATDTVVGLRRRL